MGKILVLPILLAMVQAKSATILLAMNAYINVVEVLFVCARFLEEGYTDELGTLPPAKATILPAMGASFRAGGPFWHSASCRCNHSSCNRCIH